VRIIACGRTPPELSPSGLGEAERVDVETPAYAPRAAAFEFCAPERQESPQRRPKSALDEKLSALETSFTGERRGHSRIDFAVERSGRNDAAAGGERVSQKRIHGLAFRRFRRQEREMRERLQARVGVRPRLELVPQGTLPRTEFKAKRVVDDRDLYRKGVTGS